MNNLPAISQSVVPKKINNLSIIALTAILTFIGSFRIEARSIAEREIQPAPVSASDAELKERELCIQDHMHAQLMKIWNK